MFMCFNVCFQEFDWSDEKDDSLLGAAPRIPCPLPPKDFFNWTRAEAHQQLLQDLDVTTFSKVLETLKSAPNIDKIWVREQARMWPACNSFLHNDLVGKIWLSTTNFSFKNLNILTVARTHASAVSQKSTILIPLL